MTVNYKEKFAQMLNDKFPEHPEENQKLIDNIDTSPIGDLKYEVIVNFVLSMIKTHEELKMPMSPSPIHLIFSLKFLLDEYETRRASLTTT